MGETQWWFLNLSHRVILNLERKKFNGKKVLKVRMKIKRLKIP